MRGFGIFLLVAGIIGAIASFSMDVTVASEYGRRVNNIGLMSARQNFILISCFAILCGLLIVLFWGKRNIKVQSMDISNNQELNIKCPYCAELIKPEAIKCKHCGSDISEKNISANTGGSLIFDDKKLLIKIKYGYLIDDNAVIELIGLIKEKYPESINLIKDSEGDVNDIKQKIPPVAHEAFIRKFNYFINK
ncbi:zinc ribbon domain-containing protein [Providencia rettgeri]|uniref:zinc ribbon domain-containing protein n=1 Tax=Providencia rettgeri TaxID=587 RepID=UPI001CA63CF0|nr:zinc ribbon domain-containing protein [Providencia rettgeri]QZY64966.1 zinc ribbon domain-containing protein [Providencia rettgeri]